MSHGFKKLRSEDESEWHEDYLRKLPAWERRKRKERMRRMQKGTVLTPPAGRIPKWRLPKDYEEEGI